jgi:hypothetical protein
MADAKVTDLTSATSVNPTDVLYLVQGSADKKLTIANLLANLPNSPAKFKGVLALGGTPQNLSGAGTITATETVTLLSNVGAAVINIADGVHDFQIKVVVMTSSVGTSVLSTNIGVGQISFSAVGHSALLLWMSGNWFPIGGTAVVTT